jgi:Fic family protein
MDGRAGLWVMQPGGFRAFMPKPLPPDPPLVVDEGLQSKLAMAERNLGRLDSISSFVPDPDRFVTMYVRQEAVLSSQIEGTQASLAELLEYQASEDAAAPTDDLGEVVNYLKALRTGLQRLEELPVSSRLLREVHKILMSETRGGDPSKTPGEFRRSQNWIGGTGPADARYVPPPANEMSQAMSDLEKFLNNPKPTPLLIEIGLAHAQFETIHPFLDGNGRLGRLMITFLLKARQALSEPLLYLSHFFKVHREEYYDRLQAVRTDGDWEGWISFFLTAVAQVADEAAVRARAIIALLEYDRARLRSELGRRSGMALDLLDVLVEQPIITSQSVREKIAKSQPTIDQLLSELVRLGLLQETTGRRRGRRVSYTGYLALFDA